MLAVVSESDKAVAQGVNDRSSRIGIVHQCLFEDIVAATAAGFHDLLRLIVSAAVMFLAMTYKKTSVP